MSKPVIAATPGEGPRIDPTEPIVIRQKAMAGWKRIAGAIVIAGLGCLLWWSTVSTHRFVAYAYGGIFFGCAAFLLWKGVRDAVRRPVALRISSAGIMVLGKRTPDFIRWSDIKGAHTATIGSRRVNFEIVALQLVDPQSFYARLKSNGYRHLGRDVRKHLKYYPIFSGDLDIARLKLLALVDEGIRKWGAASPDPRPETSYWLAFYRSPVRIPLAVGLILFVAVVTMPFFLGPPRWVEAADQCDVSNPYAGNWWPRRNSGNPWRRMHAVWTGPCVDGRAEGEGTLEWFRDGKRVVRYSGRIEGGRITGRGERTEYETTWGLGQLIKYEIRYDGLWKDGVLLKGTVTFPDERQYRGTWKLGEWANGMLTMPGGWQWEGQWHAGRLTGEGRAKGRQGEFKGHWIDGVPQGAGVFVTRDGRRFEGTWKDGKPVDAEMAHLQEQERWDCLWTVLPGRYDAHVRSEPWGCRIR